MPFSASGSQLPLTAFFGSRTAPHLKRKTALSKGVSSHKDPRDDDHCAGPPKKKLRQKENLSSHRRKESVGGVEKRGERSTDSGGIHATPQDVVVDLTKDEPEGLTSDSPIILDEPPATPVASERLHRKMAAASLPSPPLTAPTAKRPRRYSPGEVVLDHVAQCLPQENSSSGNVEERSKDHDTIAQVVGNNDAIVLRSPQRAARLSMPPPPLPPRASASSMPVRPRPRLPRSTSSDRWVPSSQTQELSIPPLDSDQHGDHPQTVPHTPVDQIGTVIPSSQSHERELRITDALPPAPDIFKTPVSPLRRQQSPVSPLIPDVGLDMPDAPSSPRFVQSSQSQSEHDISPIWAEALATRSAAFHHHEADESAVTLASSPPRPAESQGYDAQDEYSQSDYENSQPSTFAASESGTSPLDPASQYTDMSCPSSLPPYSSIPSQFREFMGMFDNRDEFGNEIPTSNHGTRHVTPRPRSGSPTLSHRPQAAQDQSERYAYGSPRTGRRGDERLPTDEGKDPQSQSQDLRSQGYSDSDYDSSSFPRVLPTPVREFLSIFDRSQASQASSPR